MHNSNNNTHLYTYKSRIKATIYTYKNRIKSHLLDVATDRNKI